MQFYSSDKPFSLIHAGIKLRLCPHCGRQGFLVLHGYLYGYGKTSLVRRGRRIFCNNRKMSNGCGRTFSTLHADWLRGFTIFARWFSHFLEKMKEGHTPHSAAKATGFTMHISSVYRIHKRFIHNQSRIRTFLCRVKSPPPVIDTENPAIATITHLLNIFPHHCVTKFQQFFQQPFLR